MTKEVVTSTQSTKDSQDKYKRMSLNILGVRNRGSGKEEDENNNINGSIIFLCFNRFFSGCENCQDELDFENMIEADYGDLDPNHNHGHVGTDDEAEDAPHLKFPVVRKDGFWSDSRLIFREAIHTVNVVFCGAGKAVSIYNGESLTMYTEVDKKCLAEAKRALSELTADRILMTEFIGRMVLFARRQIKSQPFMDAVVFSDKR